MLGIKCKILRFCKKHTRKVSGRILEDSVPMSEVQK